MASVHNQVLAPTQMYYCTQDPTLGQRSQQGARHNIVPVVAAAACLLVLGVTTLSSSSSSTQLVTVPRVSQGTLQAPAVQRAVMESQAHQGVIASAPEFPGAVEFDASAPMMQPVWEYQTAPTSSSWTWLLAAGSMALLPLVYLYKKLAAQEDSVFDEVLEAEAWAMASTVGAVDAPYVQGQGCTQLQQASAQVRVVDLSGASCGTEELSLKTAGVNSRHVVHKKLVAELANRRQSNAHTKTRAEVSGGGKKPYAQKGTGNARRGSTRSPLIVGGGVTFGPRNNKNYKQSINKKEGRLAISSLIQNRASLISVVKDLESAMPEISTKKAKELIVSLTGEAEEFQKGGKVLVVVEDTEAWDPKNTLYLSMRNIPNVRYMQQKQLAVADLLWPKRILMSEKAMASIKERFNA